MPKKDLTGMKFSSLTVKEYSHSDKYGRAMWLCDCDCGNTDIIVKGKYLLNGDTKSCGCRNIKRIQQMGKDNQKHNKIVIMDNVVYVYFDDKDYFTCDLVDLKYCNDAFWYLNNSGYARGIINGKRILFHNYIIHTDDVYEVDHINGNRLNNTRNNLRVVNRINNMKNKGLYSNNTSGVTGVSYHKSKEKWMATIRSDGVSYYLGEYEDFNEAVLIRKDAEDKYFGKFKRKKE